MALRISQAFTNQISFGHISNPSCCCKVVHQHSHSCKVLSSPEFQGQEGAHYLAIPIKALKWQVGVAGVLIFQ